MTWPSHEATLVDVQARLGTIASLPWKPPIHPYPIGGVYVCFRRGLHYPGSEGDTAWAAAVVLWPGADPVSVTATGRAAGPYRPGLLALREGAVLEAAARALPDPPAVLLVNASGRDHPRRAGLAVHLGSEIDLPTVGVTDRPLVANADRPARRHGATAPLVLDGDVVGAAVRTRTSARPVFAHAAWRTDPHTAVSVVLAACRRARTPEPLRRARREARWARSASTP